MRIIKIIVQYKGTNYKGWQKQPSIATIQGVLEETLSTFFKLPIKITGSGRTDEGVHALAQAASFELPDKDDSPDRLGMPIEKLPLAINQLLPDDIKITSAQEMDGDFNARFSAKQKTYSYTMYVSEILNPLLEEQALRIFPSTDIDKMAKAAKYLKGTHNFLAFSNIDKSRPHLYGDYEAGVRTIKNIKLEKGSIYNTPIIKLYVTANGFLYNMVRLIASTLVDIGIGKQPVDYIKTLLSQTETLAEKTSSATLPSKGLCLLEVSY